MFARDLAKVRPVALMVGQDRQETPLRHLARGLRDAGWEVGLVNSDNPLIRDRSTLTRVTARFTDPLHARQLAEDVYNRAATTRPDVLIFVKTVAISLERLARLRAGGTRIVVWYPDVSFVQPGVPRDLLDRIDALVTTKSYHLDHFAALKPDLPVTLVHHGFCEDVHYPQPAKSPRFDVVYVGNASPAKRSAIEALHRARPSLRLAVAGAGWPATPGWTQFDALAGEQMSRLLGSAKLALGLHYGPHGPEGWQDLVSARTFEIPACGTFMLHPDNAEVRSLYEAEREIGLFGDEAGMIAAVDRWLGDDRMRTAACERATKRARQAYGYRERGKEIAAFLARRIIGIQT